MSYPNKNDLYLDFEYKKDRNLGLVIKQVREIPNPSATNQVSYLIDEPATYSIVQGGTSDMFSVHRLKSLWTLHSPNMRLSGSNVVQGIYSEGTCQYIEDGSIQTIEGPLVLGQPGPGSINGYGGLTPRYRLIMRLCRCRFSLPRTLPKPSMSPMPARCQPFNPPRQTKLFRFSYVPLSPAGCCNSARCARPTAPIL
jgi:hypothetical protein